MSIGVVFGQMLVLFAMMAVGFFCYRKKWITNETAGHLSKLVVNIFNPILVVNGVLGQDSSQVGNNLVWNLGFIIFYFILLIIAGYLMPLILRPSAKWNSIYRLMTVFSNVGFMGIPVTRSIFGEGAMIYIAFYILGYNIMLYTYGIYIAQKSAKENEQFKIPSYTDQTKEGNVMGFWKRLLNPGVIAALLAVIIFGFGIQIPQPVAAFCNYMGNTTIPLSMILIGISIAQANMKEVFTDLRMYLFILLRMIVIPILMIFVLKGFVTAYEIDALVLGVFIVELGMPVGSIIVMLTKENGGDAAYCTRGVVLSTLASMITIPFICAFL